MKTHEAHWISSAILALYLPEADAKRITGESASSIRQAITNVFLDHPTPSWWWEHLTGETQTWEIEDGWSYVERTCPDEVCFFVPLEEHGVDLYEARPRIIQEILGECPGFEYAVVSKRYEWMLIENHHDVLIAVGEPVSASLLKTKSEEGSGGQAGTRPEST